MTTDHIEKLKVADFFKPFKLDPLEYLVAHSKHLRFFKDELFFCPSHSAAAFFYSIESLGSVVEESHCGTNHSLLIQPI